MDIMHQYLTDKFDWYEVCLERRDKALGHVHLKPTVVQLIKHMERDHGSRIALLAVRMGVTRRRVSQIAAEGVAAGLLELVDDPDDARVSIVQLTEQGRRSVTEAIATMREIEAELARRIGRENVAQLIRILRRDWGPPVVAEDSTEPSRARREDVGGSDRG